MNIKQGEKYASYLFCIKKAWGHVHKLFKIIMICCLCSFWSQKVLRTEAFYTSENYRDFRGGFWAHYQERQETGKPKHQAFGTSDTKSKTEIWNLEHMSAFWYWQWRKLSSIYLEIRQLTFVFINKYNPFTMLFQLFT